MPVNSINMMCNFLREAGKIINSGQSQSVVITGNVNDLFHAETGASCRYLPLIDLLVGTWDLPGRIVVTYQADGLIRVLSKDGLEKLRQAWSVLQNGGDEHEKAIRIFLAESEEEKERIRQDTAGNLDRAMETAVVNPTYALQLLSQLCLCSRTLNAGRPVLEDDLVVIIESADMLIPQGEDISRLSEVDRKRVSICFDWFSDPDFVGGGDAVVLIAESRSLLHQKVARLPQVLEVNITAPVKEERLRFVEWFESNLPDGRKLKLWSSKDDLAELTAGLTIHALMQLLKGVVYEDKPLVAADVVAKVEAFIKGELGEDVVEFKKPEHSLADVVGCRVLKKFLAEKFIPRIRKGGKGAISGAAVCGPNGSGKTYLFEAVAGMLGIVVLVIKNIRSKWFGDTDLKAERLERILQALGRAMIFMDEADVMLGGVGEDVHETERRLTGKIQAIMSDTRLLGKITWLLMTARIQQLSPDLRRPGRAGSLVIPVLDPEGDDRQDFIRWMVKPVLGQELTQEQAKTLESKTNGFYAAFFTDVRRGLIAESEQLGHKLTFDEVQTVVSDYIPPAIEASREYQSLQALVNCTRKSLLPDPTITDQKRKKWITRIAILETQIGRK